MPPQIVEPHSHQGSLWAEMSPFGRGSSYSIQQRAGQGTGRRDRPEEGLCTTCRHASPRLSHYCCQSPSLAVIFSCREIRWAYLKLCSNSGWMSGECLNCGLSILHCLEWLCLLLRQSHISSHWEPHRPGKGNLPCEREDGIGRSLSCFCAMEE